MRPHFSSGTKMKYLHILRQWLRHWQTPPFVIDGDLIRVFSFTNGRWEPCLREPSLRETVRILTFFEKTWPNGTKTKRDNMFRATTASHVLNLESSRYGLFQSHNYGLNLHLHSQTRTQCISIFTSFCLFLTQTCWLSLSILPWGNPQCFLKAQPNTLFSPVTLHWQDLHARGIESTRLLFYDKSFQNLCSSWVHSPHAAILFLLNAHGYFYDV